MRSGMKLVSLAVLLASCTGCSFKQRNNAPPQGAQAPSLPPALMATLIPPMPPPIPVTKEHPLKLDTSTPPEQKTETAAVAPPRHTAHHHARSAAADTAQDEAAKAAAQNAQNQAQNAAQNAQVAGGQPSEMSPIGQLSTANDNANIADRHVILDLIDSTENGLNGIKRSLNTEEQKTSTQIRTFLTRARDALKADDLDGARTLATKAHLLLEELMKE